MIFYGERTPENKPRGFTRLPVVMFDNILSTDITDELGLFNKVSYGDAEYTLVQPVELIKELASARLGSSFHRIELTSAIEKLQKMSSMRVDNREVLVALKG